jgi:hypothetical protein
MEESSDFVLLQLPSSILYPLYFLSFFRAFRVFRGESSSLSSWKVILLGVLILLLGDFRHGLEDVGDAVVV